MITRTAPDATIRFTGAIICIAATVYLVPRYLDMVAVMGGASPEPDMYTDYVKAVFWSFALWISIMAWPISLQNKKLLLAGWSAKILVTLFFMLFYEWHYGGSTGLDAYRYFVESRQTNFDIHALGFKDGTENISNIAMLHRQLLPDSYHTMKVSFAMIGLVGIYFFYRAAVIFLGREVPRLFYLLAFFPGIIFWSSILGKDPVVFFGIGVYTYGVSGWYRYKKVRFLMAICSGILTAVFIRQWLGLIMAVPMGIIFMFGLRGMATRLFSGIFTVLLIYFSTLPFLERFQIEAMEDILRAADKTTLGFVTTPGGSTQALNFDFSSPLGLMLFLPYGAFTALFRPFPGEVMNPFGLLAGLESVFLLFLLARAIKRTKLSELKEPFVLWAILFVLTWALMTGMVSSTNFGVGVRYKLQVLPILLGLLMYLARKRVPDHVG
ncbi:MAG: hypothetical protein HYS23_03365 [Geobacter sp.]|nr:hypothetical protein [Geobacter sp.]